MWGGKSGRWSVPVPLRTAAVVAMALVATVSLTACGSDAAGLPDIDPSDRAGSQQLLTQQFVVAKDDQRMFIRASRVARAQCLVRFGVEASEEGPIDEASLGVSASDRPIGIVDRVVVAKWGYHPDPTATLPAVEKGDAGGYNPSPREMALRQGVDAQGGVVKATDADGRPLPVGGCDGEVLRNVFGGADFDMFRGQNLFSQAAERAEVDPRLMEAWGLWSACMAKAGYTYDTPWEANDDARWWSQTSPSSDEVKAALTDLDCRESTGMQATWVAVLNAYERRLIDQEGASLAEWADRLQSNRRRAKELVSGSN
jgi:hypothetical protein